MAIYDIAVNNDDWYNQLISGGATTRFDGTTTITAGWNNAVFPTTRQQAYGDIDTSGIPIGDVISAATFYIYLHSYTASKGITKTYDIQMLSADELTYTTIYSGTFVSAGWLSHALTAGEIVEIDTGSGQKTRFRILVNDPGATKARTMQIRAREYVTVDTFDMYLDVTHSAPSTGAPQVLTICS